MSRYVVFASRCLAIVLGAVTGLLCLAAPASAHAALVSTSPQQRSVIGSSPAEVTLTFSEPISAVPGRAQVLAPDGKRINTADAVADGRTLRIPLRRADRPLGTYLVSYRVISADSHPVAGSFTFSVGAPSTEVPQPADDPVHPSVRVAVPVAKYLGYAGLVLVVGPALLLGALWPRRLSRRGPTRLVGAGLLLVGLSSVAGLWLQAPYRSGAPATSASAAELSQVLTSGFGVVLVARLALVGLVGMLLAPVLAGRASRARAAAVVALGLAGLATWPLSGHAGASLVPVLSSVAAVVHLAAMGVWLGGLVVLFGFLLPRAHPRALAVVLPVWSRWAATAVACLLVGGVGQALVEVGAVDQLVTTSYGRFLAAKMTLLGVVLAAAAYARRLVRRRAAPAPLRRTVGFEAAAAAVVLGLSAVLVQTIPARSAGIEAAAAVSDSFAQTLSGRLYTLQFDIYPVQLGENNTVHAYVYTLDGKPLPAKEWKLTSALPEKGIEPVTTILLGLEGNHGIGAITFPVPGTWQLRFTIRTSEIDQETVTTSVTVR